MIKAKDLYTVMSAVVPLYVTMFLAYGSVKWWNIFSPEQCAGINRFVAIFAVPLLSFEFIYNFNPYKMNLKFIAADVISKGIVLVVLGLWGKFARKGRLDWVITLFSLSTLPNTLVMGIPLLKAMYGDYAETLMVQTVVLQCIIWYTLMLFLLEYRSAKILIAEQFPGIANSIASFKVESDVLSLDGRDFLYTDAEVGEDGKLHVVVRKSSSSLSRGDSAASSQRFHSTKSFASGRPINHTQHTHARNHSDVLSVESSRNLTPRDSMSSKLDFAPAVPALSNSLYAYECDAQSHHSSVGHTPRTSNDNENPNVGSRTLNSNCNGGLPNGLKNSEENGNGLHGSRREQLEGGVVINCGCRNLYSGGNLGINAVQLTKRIPDSKKQDEDAKELHMFVWSSSGSPVSEGGGLQVLGGSDNVMGDSLRGEFDNIREERTTTTSAAEQVGRPGIVAEPVQPCQEYSEEQDFSFANRERIMANQRSEGPRLSKFTSSSTAALTPTLLGEDDGYSNDSPRAAVMIHLILNMVFRKLIRNPNSYASVLGVIWALISYRWHFKMPQIIKGSVSILSDAGLGMAMFSLGLFMALQPKIIACGKELAIFGMVVRFLTGPAVMAVASIIAGLRDAVLHIAIVQAALPQGIVPFVFAREYNLHSDVLSTAVIFGMIVAMPITILYYVLLGL